MLPVISNISVKRNYGMALAFEKCLLLIFQLPDLGHNNNVQVPLSSGLNAADGISYLSMEMRLLWKAVGFFLTVHRFALLALLLSSTTVCVCVSMAVWVGEFGWKRVTEVGSSSSLREAMEIRGTIQAVRLSLVLWPLVGWGPPCLVLAIQNPPSRFVDLITA